MNNQGVDNKLSTIASSFESLKTQIETVEKEVIYFEERIKSVLLPPFAEAEIDMGKKLEPFKCDLANTIDTITAHVGNIVNRLEGLQKRIEL